MAPPGLSHRTQSVVQRAGGMEPIPSTGLRCFVLPKRVSGEKRAQVIWAQLLFAVGFRACLGARSPFESGSVDSLVQHSTQSYFYCQPGFPNVA